MAWWRYSGEIQTGYCPPVPNIVSRRSPSPPPFLAAQSPLVRRCSSFLCSCCGFHYRSVLLRAGPHLLPGAFQIITAVISPVVLHTALLPHLLICVHLKKLFVGLWWVSVLCLSMFHSALTHTKAGNTNQMRAKEVMNDLKRFTGSGLNKVQRGLEFSTLTSSLCRPVMGIFHTSMEGGVWPRRATWRRETSILYLVWCHIRSFHSGLCLSWG